MLTDGWIKKEKGVVLCITGTFCKKKCETEHNQGPGISQAACAHHVFDHVIWLWLEKTYDLRIMPTVELEPVPSNPNLSDWGVLEQKNIENQDYSGNHCTSMPLKNRDIKLQLS